MPPKNEIVRILFFQAGSRVREQFRLTFLIVSQLRAKVERFPKKHHLCHQKNNKWHDFRRDLVPNTTGIDRSAAGKPSVRLIARNAGFVRRAESGPGCVLLKCSRLVGFRFGRKRPCGGRFFSICEEQRITAGCRPDSLHRIETQSLAVNGRVSAAEASKKQMNTFPAEKRAIGRYTLFRTKIKRSFSHRKKQYCEKRKQYLRFILFFSIL